MTVLGDLAQAHADLGQYLAVHEHVWRMLGDAAKGQPRGQRYDSPAVGGVPMSDPTHDAGTNATTDRALADMREIQEIGKQAARLADRLIRIAQTQQRRAATILERQRTERENDPGCSSCSRTEVAKGQPRWSPIHRDDLCRWCYDWRRSKGGLPPVKTLEAHHRGDRIHEPVAR